jgi:Raf kinase inhibitor-like YbhB/YbcL family protein
MRLTSSSFEPDAEMDQRHGRRFGNRSPQLSWHDVPAGTRSFALSMVDRMSDTRSYVHWLVADVPAAVTSLEEGGPPGGSRELRPYVGPFPPSGTHRYRFTLYALRSERLDLPAKVTLETFTEAAEAAALAAASLTGTFTKRRPAGG